MDQRVHIRILVIAGYLLSVLVACEKKASPAGAGSTVRDSSGVTIVENRDLAFEWQVVDTKTKQPLLELTQSGPRVLDFYGRVSAVIGRHGGVIVVDRDERKLLFFDSAGVLLNRNGRRGSGPGEFQSIATLVLLRDGTVAVQDDELRRITVYSESGMLLSTHTPSVGHAGLVGKLTDGRWVFTKATLFSPRHFSEPGLVRPIEPIIAFGGATVDTILMRPGSETYVRRGSGMSMSVFGPPYPRESFVVLTGDDLVVAESHLEEARVYTSDGMLTAIWRWATTRPQRNAQYEKDYLEDLFGKEPLDRAQTELHRILEDMISERQVAGFDRVIVDNGGNVWLRTPDIAGIHGTRWVVLGANGRALGHLIVPPDCISIAVSTQRILCRHRTEQLESAPLWLWTPSAVQD